MQINQRQSANQKAFAIAAATAIVAALALGACGSDDGADASAGASETIPQPSQAQLAAANLDKLPVAPESERVDITAPTFSNPTEITNPLFPISDLQSVIFSGKVEGKPFHTETTLLPVTQRIEWSEGQWVEVLVSQYMAYIDGRIEEVALDRYAQADDGSVWYLGEDVYDYSNTSGLIDGTAGTWLAGRDGPIEMIMPGDPQVGDVHRAENIPGIAFEEVTIKRINKTVDGPTGPVEGAMIARELHDDGTYSDKVFAPGYGEFFSGHGSEVEAMALAVPTDALGGPVPPELEALSAAANKLLDRVVSGNWSSAAAAERAAAGAWGRYQQGEVPPRLAAEMDRALKTLGGAIDAHDQEQAGNAGIDVTQSTLDLELRYRPQTEIDLARFELWARQILVHGAAGDMGGVNGDVATLDWVRDRFAHTVEPADMTRIDTRLEVLREAVVNADLKAAADEAPRLLKAIKAARHTT
ncbi:MAG TPA: hypothetical protein VN458_07795 [Solirubrobacterales bacterium]|nr:hypothetical protein [Solirubrobacterales bacterium]